MAAFFKAQMEHDRGFNISGKKKYFSGHIIPSQKYSVTDGIFVSWNWDDHDGLEVVNDRYGFYPLFYYTSKNTIIISTSLTELVNQGAPTELDYDNLAVFLHLGFYIANNTPFKHIYVLPQSSKLRWNGSLRILRNFNIKANAIPISRAKAVDNYIDLFSKSIQRRIPKQSYAMPLSGGRDSRHIFLELIRQKANPEFCISTDKYPPGRSFEWKIARELANLYGIKFINVPPQYPRIEAEIEKNILTHFCSDEHAWFNSMTSLLRNEVSCVYDGIGGGVLSASAFQDDKINILIKKKENDKIVNMILGSDISQVLKILDFGFNNKTVRNIAFELVRDEYMKHRDNGHPISSFYFWNRTRREIALSPFGMMSGIQEVFCPYLDHELFDFLYNLPAEIGDKNFHDDALLKAYPEASHIPYYSHSTKRQTFASAKHQLIHGFDVVKFGTHNKIINSSNAMKIYREWMKSALYNIKLVGRVQIKSQKFALPSPNKLLYFYQIEDFRRNPNQYYDLQK